jgi:CubicO group peptidase (beta-lactamase class C family)
MTYRHLLSQTSGIDPDRAMMHGNDIEAQGIAAKCLFAPGTSWQYSNGGIDLLSALAGRIAGEPLDVYLNEHLFAPLGIAPVDWMRDDKGVPYGAGEMKIRPLDMAKVGQALLAGNWHGKEIVPRSWATLSFAQSSPFEPIYGLLWWRLANVTSVGLTAEVIGQWRTAGVPDTTLDKLQPLVGQTYPSNTELFAAMRGVLTDAESTALNNLLAKGNHLPYSRDLTIGPVAGSLAAGWLGQYLVLVPEEGLVGVRMRRSRPSDQTSPTEVDAYGDFSSDVLSLVPSN